MIRGKLYHIKLGGYTLSVAVPDDTGEKLIEFARLAFVEYLQSDDAEQIAANAAFVSSTLVGDVWIDARAVTDVHH